MTLKSSLILVSAVLALIVVGSGPARGQSAKKWAVLVGINTYQNQDVTPLQYAVADVKALASTLKQSAGFPADNVFVMTSDQTGYDAPTRANIAFRLEWLADKVQPADTVIFYFSGHGLEMEKASYLMTVEADARSASTLEVTGLDTSFLRRKLENLRSHHLLVIVDACRNDPRGGKGSADNPLGKRMARDLQVAHRPSAGGTVSMGSAMATLYACSEGQRSYEWKDKNHGFFSYYLLEGLKGAAADSTGRVTLRGLMAYLETEVPKATNRTLGVTQRPWMSESGSDVNAWTLVAVRPPKVSTAGESTATPQSPSVQAAHPHHVSIENLTSQPQASYAPPTPEIARPTNFTRISEPSVHISGTVGTHGTLSDVKVSVNGRDVPAPFPSIRIFSGGADFNIWVPVDLGHNDIRVRAVDAAGQVSQTSIVVIRDAPGQASPDVASSKPNGAKTPPRQSVWEFPEEIGLSSDQVKELKAALDDYQGFVNERQPQLDKLSKEFDDLVKENADESRLRAKGDEIMHVKIDIQLCQVATTKLINTIMTPEQIALWKQLHARLTAPKQSVTAVPSSKPDVVGVSNGRTVATSSGQQIEDQVVGTGAGPQVGQTVVVHYTGWLTNGTKFDSSVDRGKPFEFRLGQHMVIPGFDEGVAGMKVGGKRKLTIPPNLGYGARGAGNSIPPNSTLIFEIELLNVR